MEMKLIPLYFFLGGAIVTAATYFGSQGKGTLAAFMALVPSISLVTVITIFLEGGAAATQSYVLGMLKLLPAWVLYCGVLFILIPHIGIAGSLVVGLALYVGASYFIIKFW